MSYQGSKSYQSTKILVKTAQRLYDKSVHEDCTAGWLNVVKATFCTNTATAV